ncbi:protein TonB [Bacteroidia bacterium]|nr:protein TonB [Bacteroidia bacterium]
MEKKKTDKADLENKRSLFIEIGLVFTLAVVLFAFEWKSYDTAEVKDNGQTEIIVDEEEIIQTEQNNEPPPPPPPVQNVTEIEIVDDDKEIENEIDINADDDQKNAADTYVEPIVTEEKEEVEMTIFQVVEENPGYPGGEEARQLYLTSNIKYPAIARESGISGTIYLTFVVERDGSITDVQVLRGIGGGCDEEALRVTKNMPKWSPGKQRGKPVRVQFTMPVKFVLAG